MGENYCAISNKRSRHEKRKSDSSAYEKAKQEAIVPTVCLSVTLAPPNVARSFGAQSLDLLMHAPEHPCPCPLLSPSFPSDMHSGTDRGTERKEAVRAMQGIENRRSEPPLCCVSRRLMPRPHPIWGDAEGWRLRGAYSHSAIQVFPLDVAALSSHICLVVILPVLWALIILDSGDDRCALEKEADSLATRLDEEGRMVGASIWPLRDCGWERLVFT